MLQIHLVLSPLLQEIMTSLFYLYSLLIVHKGLKAFYFRSLLMYSHIFTIFSFAVRTRLHLAFRFIRLLLPEWPICLHLSTPLFPLVVGLRELILEFQEVVMIELVIDWLVEKLAIFVVSFQGVDEADFGVVSMEYTLGVRLYSWLILFEKNGEIGGCWSLKCLLVFLFEYFFLEKLDSFGVGDKCLVFKHQLLYKFIALYTLHHIHSYIIFWGWDRSVWYGFNNINGGHTNKLKMIKSRGYFWIL